MISCPIRAGNPIDSRGLDMYRLGHVGFWGGLSPWKSLIQEHTSFEQSNSFQMCFGYQRDMIPKSSC
jgi:hypothetical protein